MDECFEVKQHRIEEELKFFKKGLCPSCREKTLGSMSITTRRRYPYCRACLFKATPATDSYAFFARGNDKGPFVEKI